MRLTKFAFKISVLRQLGFVAAPSEPDTCVIVGPIITSWICLNSRCKKLMGQYLKMIRLALTFLVSSFLSSSGGKLELGCLVQ